jgi:hypothetical protein
MRLNSVRDALGETWTEDSYSVDQNEVAPFRPSGLSSEVFRMSLMPHIKSAVCAASRFAPFDV